MNVAVASALVHEGKGKILVFAKLGERKYDCGFVYAGPKTSWYY